MTTWSCLVFFDVGGLGLQYRYTISIRWEVMCPFCSADDGVSIPGEYTSFLAPISSSKLYNEVRACREKDRDPEVKSHSLLAVSSLFNAFLFLCQHNCFLPLEEMKR